MASNRWALLCLLFFFPGAANAHDTLNKYEPNCLGESRDQGTFQLNEQCNEGDFGNSPKWTEEIHQSGLKIFEGELAQTHRFPYAVKVLNSKAAVMELHCSGTVIHASYVLTAAHCATQCVGNGKPLVTKTLLVQNDTDLEGPRFIRVKEVFVHPNYTCKGAYSYDIALLKLQKQVSIDVPIILTEGFPMEGASVSALGWGLVDPKTKMTAQQLRIATTLEVVSADVCRKEYPDIMVHQFCLHAPVGKDGKPTCNTCEGDSGGPVIIPGIFTDLDQLIGLTSRGLACDEPDSFGVYINLCMLQPWIEGKIEEGQTDGAELSHPWRMNPYNLFQVEQRGDSNKINLSEIGAFLLNLWCYSNRPQKMAMF